MIRNGDVRHLVQNGSPAYGNVHCPAYGDVVLLLQRELLLQRNLLLQRKLLLQRDLGTGTTSAAGTRRFGIWVDNGAQTVLQIFLGISGMSEAGTQENLKTVICLLIFQYDDH
ncbi:hypothetical protein NPIL_575091 [Nephila pilipes]|uniref:Uncharacterized protein n=1 Tax=Nephila pilipes TaxID=299642 RepID=A0A8X6QMQ7_NEPPI|nr:hypothetical protein NPIL_575091 [Nephila pilipes]